MGLSFEQIGLLLLVASVVALLARKVRLPYTVGLVLTGIVLAFSHVAPTASLTKHLIFTVFLPPLIFEAAISIPWKELRRNLLVILTLATVGVLLSASLTAAGMHYLVGWQWGAALLFGVLIAATDPVSVIAIFREAGIHGRLRVLVDSESLFNDGTAAVAFGVALAAVQGGAVTGGGIALSFLITVLGGGCAACSWRGPSCSWSAIPTITCWKLPSPPLPPTVPFCWPNISTCRGCWRALPPVS